MKKILLLLLILPWMSIHAQVAVNIDGSAPANSAMLDVKSTAKGVLIPRMTLDQRNAINSPADGLMVYCTNCGSDGSLSVYSNGVWKTFSPCSIASPVSDNNIVVAGQVTWKWNTVPGATGYKWNTLPNYSSALENGGSTSKVETGLTCNSMNTRYVWAYNECSVSAPLTLTQSITPSPPAVPVAGMYLASLTSITWNWLEVPGATGYKWSLTNNPSTASDVGNIPQSPEFGLACGTAYTRYVWAYNSCVYSAPLVLTWSTQACPNCDPITDVRDGKTYNTVLIGAQCWMAQNLNVGNRINGTEWQVNNGIIEKYCYQDIESNCNTYGGLYQWDEALDYFNTLPGNISQGICPTGWHIPWYQEWDQLKAFLGGWTVAGGAMKEAGTTHWASPNTGATNSSGFTALPAGINVLGGGFGSLSTNASFWCAYPSQTGSGDTKISYYLFSFSTDFENFAGSDVYGFSVRCIKD